MKRYYVVEIDTSAKEHQLERIDQTIARECSLQFGKQALVWATSRDEIQKLSLARPIQYSGKFL